MVGNAYDGDAVAAGSSVCDGDGIGSSADSDGVSRCCSAENKSGLTDGGLLLIPI